MNWFERYGITGSYFILLLSAWGYALFPVEFNGFIRNKENETFVTFLGGAAALAILPTGYILCVMQQLIYYRYPELWLHNMAMKKAEERLGKRRYDAFFWALGLKDDENETWWKKWILVLWRTFWGEKRTDKGEHIRDAYSALWAMDQCLKGESGYRNSFDISHIFLTKRIDILVMNGAIVISTRILLAIGILCFIARCYFRWSLPHIGIEKRDLSVVGLVVFSLVVVGVACGLKQYLQALWTTVVEDEYIKRAK